MSFPVWSSCCVCFKTHKVQPNLCCLNLYIWGSFCIPPPPSIEQSSIPNRISHFGQKADDNVRNNLPSQRGQWSLHYSIILPTFHLCPHKHNGMAYISSTSCQITSQKFKAFCYLGNNLKQRIRYYNKEKKYLIFTMMHKHSTKYTSSYTH
ncbi:hypothetical protein CIPAW_03G073700 [Carya illinoinensis]|uniref:Uncharacterized protein n=1 Tax=Carya illinoinensis TaxID=32201 RepID=A0A8T1QXY7_CARIL|nr:hypothetical protein CIPAW_03G073700 [Carya illinoinensis]